jgi:D-hydroxyproline dehydrogenase subunit gamma
MFRKLPEPLIAPTVTVWVAGHAVRVCATETAAAAALLGGLVPSRTSTISSEPRAPYCMMGVCFECLMRIDGVPNRQACLVTVRDGMRIERQDGRPSLGDPMDGS